MWQHYEQLIGALDLLTEDEAYLLNIGKKLLTDHEAIWRQGIGDYYEKKCEIDTVRPVLIELSELSGVHIYTIDFIFAAILSERMMRSFIDKGYGQRLFWDTIADLKYKLEECKVVKGIRGIFVFDWYRLFFKLEIFTLGRLQYQVTTYPWDNYNRADININKGDTVYSVHIPSSGPLSEDLRYDSYTRACNFFSKETKDNPLICICESWLLYEDNKNIFPGRLNMVKFMDDWDIIDSHDDDRYPDAWRLFGVDYTGDPKLLPAESTPQKSMKQWLENGGKAGHGFGVMVFDGERIINRS